MTLPLEISSDFNFLYRNGQRFYPIIQDQSATGHFLDASSVIVIPLAAAPDDELIWEKERALADHAISEGKMILWELDFGFHQGRVNSSDLALFYSLGIAIDEFTTTLYKEFSEKTLGVILYRGDALFSKKLVITQELKENFLEKISQDQTYQALKESIDSKEESFWESLREEKVFELFAADVFSQYFQRLVSYLPESLLAFCLIDVSAISDKAFLAQLLSKERFQHITLALRRSSIPVGQINWEEGACFGGWIGSGSPYISAGSDVLLGVCLPLDEYIDDTVSSQLAEILDQLSEKQIAYRIIPETLLTEAWDGIDHIIVISSSLSFQGKRRLQGFCAAGGVVVHRGLKIGLPLECPWEEFSLQLQHQEVLI